MELRKQLLRTGIFLAVVLLAFVVVYEFNQFVLPALKAGSVDETKAPKQVEASPAAENQTGTPTTEEGSEQGNNGSTVFSQVLKNSAIIAECGDEICDADEDCQSCLRDCGCTEAEYCNFNGVCKPREHCGDGSCTNMEKLTTESCCSDCGCEQNGICDVKSQKCLQSPSLKKEQLQKAVEKFTTNSGDKYALRGTYEQVLEGKAYTVVALECEERACNILLYIDENGEVAFTLRPT